MAITFEQFFQSIVSQESGGNYSAVGPMVRGNRAYGKYQVMDFNIPSWTKQYLGRSLTVQQYLADHDAQDKVAKGRLKSYWDKYGARGAASAWYSGNPDLHMSTRKESGGPSIKQYVDEVINRAGGLPAGGGSAASAPSGGGATVTSFSGNELAEQYGYVEDLFNSNPELKALFAKATAGQWTPQKFQAEVRDTKWWKSNPESARKFLTLQAGDPATAKQQLEQMIVKLTQASSSLGGPTDYKSMRAMALKAIMGGWNDGQIRWQLAKSINLKGSARPGEFGENYDKLAGYAYEMGVNMSDTWLDSAAQKIVGGVSSYQEMEDAIRRNAKGQYSAWAKQIDGGQTVADLASPYFQSMASILELPQGSINLYNPLIKKALQAKSNNGESMIKPMWQFENELRGDPRWRKTKNAQNSVTQVTRQVLSDFGFSY